MPTVLITGGTGTIGKTLSNMLLQKGYEVIVLSRNPEKQKSKDSHVLFAKWDIEEGTIDEKAFEKADYIINLAGAGVADKRWTDERKKEIVYSRTKSGDVLVKYLRLYPNNVKAMISASATGFYGEDKSTNKIPFTENDALANDFLAKTCQHWEQHIKPVEGLGKRLVILRTGIVLSKDGGAFVEFKKPLNFGVATILGNGKQIISWIHTQDICNLYIFAMENEALSGTYNAVAPKPVSNEVLIKSIAKANGKFHLSLHAPQFALKLALGEMSTEILKSATVSASKIEQAGFKFAFPDIDSAVRDLLS